MTDRPFDPALDDPAEFIARMQAAARVAAERAYEEGRARGVVEGRNESATQAYRAGVARGEQRAAERIRLAETRAIEAERQAAAALRRAEDAGADIGVARETREDRIAREVREMEEYAARQRARQAPTTGDDGWPEVAQPGGRFRDDGDDDCM